MFDKAAILRNAWKTYNTRFRPLFRKLDRSQFAYCLALAWAEAKKAFRLAAIPAKERAARVAGLKTAISELSFKSFRYDIAAERGRLQAEINALETCAA